MAIIISLYYEGANGSAKEFAEEMEKSGTTATIRAEKGNLRYDYFFPANDPEMVLLISSQENQGTIDVHHASPIMGTLAEFREKYDLHITIEYYMSDDNEVDNKSIQE